MNTHPGAERDRRDFLGYAGNLPDFQWPNGAKLALSLVVNFEEGAEFSIGDGDPVNEGIYEVIDPLKVSDPCIESHFEYGTRVGWWRMMDLLDHHQALATVSACGKAVQRSPELARDAIARGHEVAAHGWRWESHALMDEETERKAIKRTVEAITNATGQRPVGWHTRSATSPNTRNLLVEEGGFLYDSDAYNDDLPYDTIVDGKRHVILPYAFDTNDMHFQHTQRFRGSDFSDYVIDAVNWMLSDREPAPRMLSIGLHLRMISRPGRIGTLDAILKHVANRDDVWITTRANIARHWLSQVSSPI